MSTTESDQTPTPWGWRPAELKADEGLIELYHVTPEGRIVIIAVDDFTEADAELIVRAVNAYNAEGSK